MKPRHNEEIHEIDMFTYWVENGNLLVTISKDVERTMENAPEFIALLQRLSENGKKKICTLTDGNLARPFSPEMRQYYNDEMGRYVKASAMFAQTQMGNAMGFIYATLHGDTFDVKLCGDEQEAREWLQNYLLPNPSVQRPAEMDAESDMSE